METFEFKAEMKQLLNIIVHSLYNHPEVFLRELISNSSDALNKARFRKLTDKDIVDPDADLEIRIEVDSKKDKFSIEDFGIGMTKEELINNIGTIASSGTLEFLRRVKEQKAAFEGNLIGQFGVGFYSVFMVADEVSVETRGADSSSKGYLWKSGGEGNFTIEEIDRKHRGTKISFKFKESAKEFSQDYRIKEIINKYSNFADFPILLNGEKVNKVTALWHKKTDELKNQDLDEFYKFVSNDFEGPLGHLHMSIEGVVNFKALVFIPKTAPQDLMRLHNEKSLHLYANKILIQNDCKELLPEYLRFVKGVVDTTDLPLNISREVTQSSPEMLKIKSVITSKILSFLESWAQSDKEKYAVFYKNFGPLLKVGINSDFENKDKIIELLRFESSLRPKGELVSFKEYVQRMLSDQKEIYYLSGENREILERNPNLEYFNKHKIEVLFLTEPMDVFVVPSIPEYDKKHIVSIQKSDIDLKAEERIEKPDDNLTKSLISLFKAALGGKVEDVLVSKRLVDSPVTLVSGKSGLEPQMERMMRMMDKDFQKQKRILEVNITHPLIRNLSRIYLADTTNPILNKCINQLYEGALFIDGELNAPGDFIKRMTEIMQEATEK
ncbi:MAG: molecular chaperone HtpG [Omnitrophica WOR_2 bacterium GWB2_45_9]|nr:MAG: molecular chaperone HtpG [Omnitrophica WOR_2 bacterium GWB2_45_9]OGX48573.1 MAG: molecular chaperone HtpG [Omnitrophica WOR_2 bacterium RIFOXYA2_FULL_45_12]OGX61489.1 MAG: molecular chaperone HtpG [Omnitrophica WOR_2 bacterium RIFOXYC2_FULL_45_15]HBU08028.1 molecular chaperone HtpG [Candidatus Omnitrophota bacterium]